MRWSKLRKLVTQRFADDLKGRLDIHSAAYGACACGHAWMTYDGQVVANFCTRAHWIAGGREPSDAKPNSMYVSQFAQFGEFSRQDAYQSCWAFVHDLSIDQALQHDDPLVRALAVADERVGKRRIATIAWEGTHPLVRLMLSLRTDPETDLTAIAAELKTATGLLAAA